MDDRYTSQAPDWNSWVSGGDLHPPEEPVDPMAVLAEKRRLAQEALLAAQPNASAPAQAAPEAPPAAPFNGLQEGQVVQPPPAGWRPPPTDMPVPPVPPDVVPPDPKANSPVAAALGGPTQAPTAAPAPTPAAPVAEALATPVGPSTTPAPPAVPTDKLTTFAAPYVPGQTNYYGLVRGGEAAGAGDTSVKNPNSTAHGPVQVTAATEAAFLASPAGRGMTSADLNTVVGSQKFTQWNGDTNAATITAATGRPPTTGQVVAAHLVGGQGAAALLTHPETPISQLLTPGAIAGNKSILNPTMTGAQAMASIQNYYAGRGGAGTGSDVTTAASTSTPLAAPQDVRPGAGSRQAQMDAILDGKMPYSPEDLRGGPGDGLLAFAGGLLSGKSPSDAFGKGFTALSAHGQAERSNMAKANALQTQLNSLGIRGQTAAGNLDHKGVTEGQGDKRIAQADERIKLLEKKLEDEVSGAKGSRKETVQMGVNAMKDNTTQFADLQKQAQSAQDTIHTIDRANDDIMKTAPGPDAASKMKRWVATTFNLDVGSDPKAQQLVAAMDAANQRGTLQNLGIGRILEKELPFLKAQVGSLETTGPEAYRELHDFVRAKASKQLAAFQEINSLPDDKRAEFWQTPGAVTAVRTRHVAEMDNAPAPTARAPAAAPASDGWATTPGGFRYRIVK